MTSFRGRCDESYRAEHVDVNLTPKDLACVRGDADPFKEVTMDRARGSPALTTRSFSVNIAAGDLVDDLA